MRPVLAACVLLLLASTAWWTRGQTFDRELGACQRRLVAGYTTSGIRVTPDDALTIRAACERAVRERLGGRS